MALRLLWNCSFAVGLGLLVSLWNPQSGLAVGIASVVIGIVLARYRIGRKRLGALVITAIFGKVCSPLADTVIDATEDENPDESQDRIANWIKGAWESDPPRLSVSLLLLSVAVGIGVAFAVFDYQSMKFGNTAFLLPLANSHSPLDEQAFCLGFACATVLASILLSLYSIALRRVLIVSATSGGCFGAIVGVSGGDWTRGAIPFALVFAVGAIAGAILVMWPERHEEQAGK